MFAHVPCFCHGQLSHLWRGGLCLSQYFFGWCAARALMCSLLKPANGGGYPRGSEWFCSWQFVGMRWLDQITRCRVTLTGNTKPPCVPKSRFCGAALFGVSSASQPGETMQGLGFEIVFEPHHAAFAPVSRLLIAAKRVAPSLMPVPITAWTRSNWILSNRGDRFSLL